MRKQVFLDVVGHGDELPAIEVRLRSLLGANVVFHGALPQKRVGEIMGRDDVSVIMGDYHTYGQVYREGMACGTIQIARDCFAARGVITDCRAKAPDATGILYRAPEEAAREIANLLKNAELRGTLQANCLERAKGFPSWREVFETQLFGPMEEVVSRHCKRNTFSGVIWQAIRRAK
jgi:glycosyltransferase involved in cell wall biosynthesis